MKKMNPEEELLKMLSEELTRSIDAEIVETLMMPTIESDIKSTNRDRKIESVIEDKEYIEMKKEDHPYYKRKRS